jgi:hypothetical protein
MAFRRRAGPRGGRVLSGSGPAVDFAVRAAATRIAPPGPRKARRPAAPLPATRPRSGDIAATGPPRANRRPALSHERRARRSDTGFRADEKRARAFPRGRLRALPSSANAHPGRDAPTVASRRLRKRRLCEGTRRGLSACLCSARTGGAWPRGCSSSRSESGWSRPRRAWLDRLLGFSGRARCRMPSRLADQR